MSYVGMIVFLLSSLHSSMPIYGNFRCSKARHQALVAWKHSCSWSSIVWSWVIWGWELFCFWPHLELPTFGPRAMVKSKKPFSCPNFGAELWRTKNIFVFSPPRFGDDHWKMEGKNVIGSSNVFQTRLLFSWYYSFPIMELQCKICKTLVESQKKFFWSPMFNIELWRPR